MNKPSKIVDAFLILSSVACFSLFTAIGCISPKSRYGASESQGIPRSPQASFNATLRTLGEMKTDSIRPVSLSIKNTAFISQSINPASFEKDLSHIVHKRILLPKHETLYIVINSNGGDTNYASALSETIKSMPNTELICHYCASAAGGILQSSSSKRLVYSKSKMLMHEMYLTRVTAKQFTDELKKDLIVSSDEFNKIFYTKMKMSKKDYETRILNKDWMVDANEMLKLNLADELVKIECDQHIKTVLSYACESQ